MRRSRRLPALSPEAAKDAELLDSILANAVYTPRVEPDGFQQLPSGVRRSIVAAGGAMRVEWDGRAETAWVCPRSLAHGGLIGDSTIELRLARRFRYLKQKHRSPARTVRLRRRISQWLQAHGGKDR